MALKHNITYKTKEQALEHTLGSVKVQISDTVRNLALVAMDRWGDQEYKNGIEAAPNLVKTVFETSQRIKDDRSQYDILASGMEELGELGLELRIKEGNSYKEPGKDGIVGEAIDVIAVMLDMICVENPSITTEEINNYLAKKCKKWESNAKKRGVLI